ncbi:ATP phosphoribosyltransferase regulatory subunit [Indiicoccus explosivorum]|uniref:ATP phosphoribosyltransferase regulatory subunit n=1 Tax=Indiicoccus explosivorum TaxID=1917864 RepID=UPI000B44D9B7|nr:ATP phosphoribosyltransferase regulatory subunit [Indiicoccus explosivorum]
MTAFIFNPSLIRQKEQEVEFLTFFHTHEFDVIDLPVVETFDWTGMTPDDLSLMPRRETWVQNGKVHTLRHDWTNAIVRYLQKYHVRSRQVAYSGPVYKNGEGSHQFGMEVFSDVRADQQHGLALLLEFIRDRLQIGVQTAVISHYALLKSILTPEQYTDPDIRRALSQRSTSRLQQLLGDHPLPQLLELQPESQLHKLRELYPELEPILGELTAWEEEIRRAGIEAVYPDITALPSQSYYDGVFIQLYEPGRTAPFASGGQYTAQSKAFGMGIFY